MIKMFMIVLGMVTVLANVSIAADTLLGVDVVAEQIKNSDTNKELSMVTEPLRNLQKGLPTAVKSAAKDELLRHKMEQQMREHLTPDRLVPLFFKQIDQLIDEKIKREKLQDLQATLQHSSVASQDGGISGRVTVDGISPTETVTVFVFDSHGYFAGSDEVDEETGEYTVTDLPSDSFYVVTRSGAYVDEIYNDIKSPLGSWETWRLAEKVFVPQAVIGGIDFELENGVKVSGTVTDGEGVPLETTVVVDFLITPADEPVAVATASCEVVNGFYEFNLPSTGRFKVQALSNGYEARWFGNVESWDEATVVEIASLSDTPVLDFQLPASESGLTGEISGTISPAVFAVAGAFNAADTSFAGMGISIGLLFVSYTIPDLPPGDYFVYADDYLGTLLGAANSRGEFYDGQDGTPFVKQAKTVNVVAGEATEDIDFSLDAGATIKGKITDSSGAPLDSLSLLLINADLLAGEGDPFLARFELHIVSTDFNGEYEIPGLRAGTYYLRTFSDYFINFDLGNTDSLLLDGKHKGLVIDQYYGGEQNLLRVMDVEPLVLETESVLAAIDMTLNSSNFILGSLFDAGTSKPVTDVTVVALEDTSGFPWFPLAEIDSLGAFQLGPLPQGRYKVLVISGFNGDSPYLSEYYNDQRSFYQANIVDLDHPRVDNIDIDLEKGAVIQGFVDLAAGNDFYAAGADEMEGMPVVAYDAQSGKVASYDFVQFNGGWRINRLLPGSYKVQVVPQPGDYAATYLGGGDVFDDAANSILTLNYSDVTPDQIVELEQANGVISGVVVDSLTGEPLSSIFVGAYDAGGHIVGYSLTDIDETSGRQISSTGSYAISGLRDGAYYVRTVSLFSALPLVEQVSAFVGIFENFDIFNFLFDGSLTSLNLSLSLYKDFWYPNTPAGISIDLNELVFQASAYGLANENDNALLPVYLPLPFYEAVPSGAQMVSVSQGSATTVDFVLPAGTLEDLSTNVTTGEKLPSNFSVQQNYPNPFNPSTTLSFSLPGEPVDNVVFFAAG